MEHRRSGTAGNRLVLLQYQGTGYLFIARLLLSVSVILAGAGCADDGTPDPPQNPPGQAQRIISLVPAVTDLLVEMGAAHRLVARTNFDRDARLAALPSVGDGLSPGLEGLLAKQPDLVISWPDAQARKLVTRLTEMGVATYDARVETIDDVAVTALSLGRMLGLDSAATALVERLGNQLDQVKRSVAERRKACILYVIHVNPPMSVGPGSFVHELIEIAGGRNVFADAGSPWPHISLEEVIRRQPDMVVMADANAAEHFPGTRAAIEYLQSAPGWRELEAVRQGRVVAVDPYLFNRPGPRLGQAARQLADLIHLEKPAASQPADGPAGRSAGQPADRPADDGSADRRADTP